MSILLPPAEMIELARDASTHSPCRSKRGVVLFVDTTHIAAGWNDMPMGFVCTKNAACKRKCAASAIHAEMECILQLINQPEIWPADITLEMLHVKTIDGTIVASGPPSCVQCSKHILRAGISWMWLYHADGWRRYDAVDFHKRSLENSK